MSGNIALLHLPDNRRPHIQLTTYFYASTLAKVRRDIIGNRAGVAVIEVGMPISVPLIEVAMDRRSTYVQGFRVAGAPHWWAFQEKDKPLPALPGGPSRTMSLSGSYTELGLPPAINMRPDKMLTLLTGYNGKLNQDFCRGIVLLLFLVAEALRFDSLLMECARYFSFGGTLNTIHPAAHAATVQNWAKSLPGDPNVLVPYLGPA
jgi:hypothetical protein